MAQLSPTCFLVSVNIDLQLHCVHANSLTNTRNKARLTSRNLSHAGDWLNVAPSHVLGMHVRLLEFRYSIISRLGAPFYNSSGPYPACVKPSDRYHGDHSLACAWHLLPGTNANPALDVTVVSSLLERRLAKSVEKVTH